MKITPHDIIWATGLFEGDGTCRYSAYSECASVTQKDTWLLYHLRSLFGGAIAQQTRAAAWQLYGANARGFLQSIYATGLLSPRREKQIENTLWGERQAGELVAAFGRK